MPRTSEPIAKLRAGAKELGLFLATIVPRSPELLEEVAYEHLTDGSLISLRRDRITNTPQVFTAGPQAEEFHGWAMENLDCWTAEEILTEAASQLRGVDIDGIVDAVVVLFMCAPPNPVLDPRWLDLAWTCFEHPDADVRHAAVAAIFFRLWESPEVQKKIEALVRDDPSESVRARAKVMCAGWSSSPPLG